MSDKRFPYELVSASISGGYHDALSSSFRPDTHFVGHHNMGTRPMQGTFTADRTGFQHRRNPLYAGSGSNPARREAWNLTFVDGAAKVSPREVGQLSSRYGSVHRSVASTTNFKSNQVIPVPFIHYQDALAVPGYSYYDNYISNKSDLYAHYSVISGTWVERTGFGPAVGAQVSGTAVGSTTDASGSIFSGSVFEANTGSAQADGYLYNLGRQDNESTTIGGLSDFSFIQNSGVFTMAGWFRTRGYNSSDFDALLGNSPASSENGIFASVENRPSLGVGESAFRFTVNKGSSGTPLFASFGQTGSITPGKLHHFAVTADGSGYKTYIDAVEDTSGNFNSGFATGDSTRTMLFGACNFSSVFYGASELYEISFATGAWSSAEVLDAYSGGIGHYSYYDRVIKDLPGVVSHWTNFSPVTSLPEDVGPGGLTAALDGTVDFYTGSVRRGTALVGSDGTDGSNYIDLGTTGSYTFLTNGGASNEFAASAWFRFSDWDNGSRYMTILGLTLNAATTRSGFAVNATDVSGSGLSNMMRFYLNYGGTTSLIDSPNDILRLGWHHVCVTKNSSNLFTLYVDGEPHASATNGGTGTGDRPLRMFNAEGTGLGITGFGRVGEVTIASASWNASEVFNVYASGCLNEQYGLGAQHMWPLADGYGGAVDAVQGVSGTMAGTIAAASPIADGQFGAYGLNASGDHVTFSDAELSIDWDNDWSMVVFATQGDVTNREIVTNAQGSSVGPGFSLYTIGGAPRFRVYDAAGNGVNPQVASSIVGLSGPAIACVYNKSTETAEIHVIRDTKSSIESAYADISALTGSISGSVDDLRAGFRHTGAHNGSVANLSLYSRALTLNELIQLFEWYNPT